MTFSSRLLDETFRALSLNRPMVLIFLAANVALQILDEQLGRGGTAGQLILFSMMAICIHQAVIKTDFKVAVFTPNSMLWSYGWRLLGMWALAGVPAFVLTSLFPIPAARENLFVGLFVIMFSILYALALSMWGTALPAVAVGGDAGLASATARGKMTIGYSAARFFLCLGPLLIMGFALLILLSGKLNPDNLKILGGSIRINFAPLTVTLLASLFGLFNTALASTILSRAYLIGEAKIGQAAA